MPVPHPQTQNTILLGQVGSQPGQESVFGARLHIDAPRPGEVHHQALAAEQSRADAAGGAHPEAHPLAERDQVPGIYRVTLTGSQINRVNGPVAGQDEQPFDGPARTLIAPGNGL